MDTNTLIIVVAVALLVAAVLISFRVRKSRTLKQRFGPEYSRVVDEAGGKRKAESELAQRAKRVTAMQIRPLQSVDRARYLTAWTQLQADFVDSPKAAVSRADDLLGEVMTARGYPVAYFDQRAADLSVDHPQVVENYREGHDIALRHGRGGASTEDLRQAMIHYRALFEHLVDEHTTQPEISSASQRRAN